MLRGDTLCTMRVVMGIALAMLGVVLFAWSGAGGRPAAPGSTPLAMRATDTARRTPASRTPVTPATEPDADEPAADTDLVAAGPLPPLELVLLDRDTLAPLVDARLRLWLHGDADNRLLELKVDGRARAQFDRGELDGARGLQFELFLPQFEFGLALPSDLDVMALRHRVEPVQVLVPTGYQREIRVVDEFGAAVEGAHIAAYPLRLATTDRRGIADIHMTDEPVRTVEVLAACRRVVTSRVPPRDVEWIVVLPAANRLEVELVSLGDRSGYHVAAWCAPSFRTGTSWQSVREQVPGRPTDGTPARWSWAHDDRRASWQLGFGANGLAVIDQLHDAGTIDVELWYFDLRLETRRIEFGAEGAAVRVTFRETTSRAAVGLRVVDRDGGPLAAVRVRMAPLVGATIDLPGIAAFPSWAPEFTTDRDGSCRVPRPDSSAGLVVLDKPGFAPRAHTLAELDASAGRVTLTPGRTVTLEVLDRDLVPIDGGWSSGIPYLHARPSVHLGHGVWRDLAPGGEAIPFFRFDDLPDGIVEFRFSYLPAEVRLRHDTHLSTARFVADVRLVDLAMGK